jgi:hypothetical protein
MSWWSLRLVTPSMIRMKHLGDISRLGWPTAFSYTPYGPIACISYACCFCQSPQSRLHPRRSDDSPRRHVRRIWIFREGPFQIMPMLTEPHGYRSVCFTAVASATFSRNPIDTLSRLFWISFFHFHSKGRYYEPIHRNWLLQWNITLLTVLATGITMIPNWKFFVSVFHYLLSYTHCTRGGRLFPYFQILISLKTSSWICKRDVTVLSGHCC